MFDDIVKQFKVIQKNYSLFHVILRIDDNSKKQEVEECFLENLLEEKLNMAEFQFEYVDTFINDNGKKLRYFINEIKGENTNG